MLIAVGYTLTIPVDEFYAHLNKKKCDIGKHLINSDVHSGVLFHPSCKGNLGDAYAKDENELVKWYEKHSDVTCVYVRRIYITNKYIIGEIEDGKNTRFYTILSCIENKYATTQHKRNVINGHYGSPINIDCFTIPAKVYKYENDCIKNEN